MLNLFDDLLMDCPSMISRRACCRCSSVYCLYRRTGADDSSCPASDTSAAWPPAASEAAEGDSVGCGCGGAPRSISGAGVVGGFIGVAVIARAPLAIWKQFVMNDCHTAFP